MENTPLLDTLPTWYLPPKKQHWSKSLLFYPWVTYLHQIHPRCRSTLLNGLRAPFPQPVRMEFPSPTKTWHNASYPAISPSNTALSVKGKTIFITGGGAGIGLAIAYAFAAAGASTVAISGRTEKTLLSAKNGIESAHKGVTVRPFVADVIDQKAVDATFACVGKVDILVHNAGYLPRLVPISQSRLQDWWSGFETNVKGAFIVT